MCAYLFIFSREKGKGIVREERERDKVDEREGWKEERRKNYAETYLYRKWYADSKKEG